MLLYIIRTVLNRRAAALTHEHNGGTRRLIPLQEERKDENHRNNISLESHPPRSIHGMIAGSSSFTHTGFVQFPSTCSSHTINGETCSCFHQLMRYPKWKRLMTPVVMDDEALPNVSIVVPWMMQCCRSPWTKPERPRLLFLVAEQPYRSAKRIRADDYHGIYY